ncbi:MAG TPA: recombination mediator RecR [Candidatus Saccharimonadales bacterium]|nr:recombination mediator RecR [Candidatus Saccharimonadales bacterium]
MKIPKSIAKLIDSFERLPGIGPKTAQRLTFYMLHFPQEELDRFAEALQTLKTSTKICRICKNVGEEEVCSICSDLDRNQNLIAVVASPLDVFALEKTGYKGVYHVLHGVIDPLNNIGPDEIFINELINRLKDKSSVEIILATNTSMEGESTAMYIVKLIRDQGYGEDQVTITRIARGLPVGGEIEYADDNTLNRALEGRLKV